MYRCFNLLTALLLATFLLACAPGDQEKSATPATNAAQSNAITALQSDAEKLSYAFGLEVGASLQQVPAEIDIEIFNRGVADSLTGKTPLLTEEEAATVRQDFLNNLQEQQAKQLQEAAEQNLKEGEAFLEENRAREEVTTTESGLQYEVLRQGDGAVPEADDIVTVHYRGTMVDGTEFDSSYDKDEPITLPVAGMIEGWAEALQLMPVGSKYKLFMPAELAFGERGAGQVIGPNSALVFEVELLSIEEEAPIEEEKIEPGTPPASENTTEPAG